MCYQGAIKTIPWTRRDVTYLNYDIVKQEITKVHKALHREMKAFNMHLHQPVSTLLTDTDAESTRSSSAEYTFTAHNHIDVSQFCVDAAEVRLFKFRVCMHFTLSKNILIV